VILIQFFSFILYNFEKKINYSLEIFKILKIFFYFIAFNFYAKKFLQLYLLFQYLFYSLNFIILIK